MKYLMRINRGIIILYPLVSVELAQLKLAISDKGGKGRCIMPLLIQTSTLKRIKNATSNFWKLWFA